MRTEDRSSLGSRGRGAGGAGVARRGGPGGLAALLWLLAATAPGSTDGDGLVRAVLFVSPTCPHCRTVEERALPAFAERFGPRLEILIVSTATPSGVTMLRRACRRFGVPRPGVPMLVVDGRVLLGSQEIPERFPDLAEDLLAAGGSSWPDIPGLEAALAQAGLVGPPPGASPPDAPLGEPPVATPERGVPAAPSPASSPRPPAAPDDRPGFMGRMAMDPYGNSLAVVVLVVMVIVVARSALRARRVPPLPERVPAGWAIPVLSVLGLGVASYLSWVEIGHAEAVCGPVGDCNTVQQSEYATLFGLVPVGVLGAAAFTATLGAWVLGRVARGRVRVCAAVALLALTGSGVLFSIYLTFLEPFVIGATCLWCLGSAVIVTLLYRLSLDPGRSAVADLLGYAPPVRRLGRRPGLAR